MSKTLVICRHAHRDTTKRELDNGLDDKGREQAKNLRRFFAERFSPEDFKKGLWLVSSPKIRCMETLLPIARTVDRAVDAHPDLDEQGPKEGSAGLQTRVQRFLNEWRNSKVELTILCSHGDWIPLAAKMLLGLEQDFKKGCWFEVEHEDGHNSLKWYLPTFRPLFK